MQISGSSTTSTVAQLQALTTTPAQDTTADAGQTLPGDAADAPAPPPPGAPQLSADMLASLLDAQQADQTASSGQTDGAGGGKTAGAHHHHHHHAGGAAPADSESAASDPATADGPAATDGASLGG